MVPRTASRSMRKCLEPWNEAEELHHHHMLSWPMGRKTTADFKENLVSWPMSRKTTADWKDSPAISTLYSDYFTAAFVRNPWDKIISYYGWYINSPHVPELAFWQFIKAIETKKQIMGGLRRIPHEMMHAHTYCEGVQNIYKYEKLPREWQRLCDDAGIEAGPMEVNIGKWEKKGFYEYFESQEMIDRVAKEFKKDIKLYNYKIPQLEV